LSLYSSFIHSSNSFINSINHFSDKGSELCEIAQLILTGNYQLNSNNSSTAFFTSSSFIQVFSVGCSSPDSNLFCKYLILEKSDGQTSLVPGFQAN
jgi:hypothetical protein